jgi:hypothetical protein
VRFLGRRVYAGLVLVLVIVMIDGLKPERVRRIREVLQVELTYVEALAAMVVDSFVRSSFWKGKPPGDYAN